LATKFLVFFVTAFIIMQFRDASLSLSGGRGRARRQIFINITSLIDVIFMLLIFFAVSSTFLEQPGMKLELPPRKAPTLRKSNRTCSFGRGRHDAP
jgi:hypothetical protein